MIFGIFQKINITLSCSKFFPFPHHLWEPCSRNMVHGMRIIESEIDKKNIFLHPTLTIFKATNSTISLRAYTFFLHLQKHKFLRCCSGYYVPLPMGFVFSYSIPDLHRQIQLFLLIIAHRTRKFVHSDPDLH